MTARAVDAALFDLDGLAVDSEPLHVEAWRRAMVDAGAGWEPAWIDPYFGTPVETTVAGLSRDHGLAPERVRDLRDRHFDELVRRGIPPRPGLAEAVRLLREGGLGVGLVSSGARSYVEHALRGLADVRFDAVVTADDVSKPKPDPEPYLRGAALLGAEPGRCVALEDAPAGVRSALAAGMAVVVVPNEHTAAMAFDGASAVVPGLVDAARWILARAAGDQ